MAEKDAPTNDHTSNLNTASNPDHPTSSMLAGNPVVNPINGGPWNSPASYIANTDGFAICVITGPASSTDGSLGWAFGHIPGMVVYATGGNIGFFGPHWSECSGSNTSTFTLPVAAGQTFSLGYLNLVNSCQQADASFAFYWMSFGNGMSSGEEALKSLSSPPNDLVIPPLPASSHLERAISDEPRREFIAILEGLLGKKISSEDQEKLLSVLRQF